MKNRYVLCITLFLISMFGLQAQTAAKEISFSDSHFVVLEIEKYGETDPQTTTLHFENGRRVEISENLYSYYEANNKGMNPEEMNRHYTHLTQAQTVLLCLEYMKDRKYQLISGTSTQPNGGSRSEWSLNYYSYQYVFEKKN